MSALVAKSYQDLEQVSDIYSVNGRNYVKVRMKNGSIKQVRAYSESEYHKYNPEVKIIQKPKSPKMIYGFGDEGFIWVFKGDTYSAIDWFRLQPTKFARMFGWYLASSEPMPDPLPAGITPVKLHWEDVCDEDEFYLKDEKEIRKFVDTLVYDSGTSEWVGSIGQRLTLPLTCTKIVNFENAYGLSTIFSFEDDDGNAFIWSTSTSKDIKENYRYMISGTVKAHDTYKSVKQTSLSRCKIHEELGHFNS